MNRDDEIRAELQLVNRALEERLADVRAFSAEFFPKLTAIGASPAGQAALVSVLSKQMIAPFFHSFKAAEPRAALLKALELLVASLKAAPAERLN
jgi:hypothetical protein